MHRERWTKIIGCLAICGLALGPPLAAEDGDSEIRGAIELLYRSVSQDGSTNKYNEDFDGLDSGVRLGSLSLDWTAFGDSALDYARVEAVGLGGDPYERGSLRLGRKDVFDLSFNHTKQDYIYDLFELVPNEDGATWDAERRSSDLTLKIHAVENVTLFFQFRQRQRKGSSLFMKDLERDVFRLETPLDMQANWYTAGVNFDVGPVDILFRQTLRRYDNQFDNSTEGNLGLDLGDATTLDLYEWMQNDSGGTDWTTLTVQAPLGNRVDLSVSLLGTFLGEDNLSSRVIVEALGTDFTGAEFGGTCAVSGAACSTDATCDALNPGDVCVPNIGVSRAELEGDTTMIDADLSVRLADPVDLHLQYRSLDRDLDGTLDRDLDGDGVFEDEDGDGIPGSTIRNDYSVDTMSAIVDYRPMRQLGVRAGYRLIERDLVRNGFGLLRDLDYESGDDDAVILGLTVRPVGWFRLNADYEDGDIEQPFNAVAPAERQHTRLRASFLPQEEMRIDLGYLDFENTNTAPDIRAPGSFWASLIEGTTTSVSFSHRANDNVSYMLRYAEQEVDSGVGITFDAGFAAVEDGVSIFTNDNTQLLGHINFAWGGPWKAHVRYWSVESDGDNPVCGVATATASALCPSGTGLVANQVIDQDLTDAEIGLSYDFDSGIFVGGALRDFDYDDANDLLDYDGQILTLRLGMRF